jgi:hypothetical protein
MQTNLVATTDTIAIRNLPFGVVGLFEEEILDVAGGIAVRAR